MGARPQAQFSASSYFYSVILTGEVVRVRIIERGSHMIRFRLILAAGCLFSALAVAFPQGPADEGKHSKDEQLILDLVNKARAEKKLPPFKANVILIKVARAHSANMAKQMKVAHVLDGKDPAQRVDEAKYDYADCNENLAFMSKNGNYQEVFKRWMASPIHGPNIVGKLEETGIGIVAGKGKDEKDPKKVADGFYITQLFGTQQKQ
jgi:uncharacterized protein YkwD